MTPEEQRIALAEWAGWKYSPDANSSIKHEAILAWYRHGNSPWHLEQLPDYLNDLNAVHKLEMKLNINQLAQYADQLDKVCVPVHICHLTHWAAVTCSTAAQRCEALLKTLNLWKP